jgi:hypothetical protein
MQAIKNSKFPEDAGLLLGKAPITVTMQGQNKRDTL